MQHLKQTDGSIVSFEPTFVLGDDGKKVQVTSASGTPTTKAEYDEQEAKRAAAEAAAKAEAAKPKEVTARQFKEALILKGKDEVAEAAIASMPESTVAEKTTKKVVKNLYYTSNNFQKSNPTLLAFAPVIGLNTPAEIDAFFAFAAAL